MDAIVLFDGMCNFCNASVNFIIERDSKGYFKFAPLQSDIGLELQEKYRIDKTQTESVILIEDDVVYTHSTAALRIAGRLDGLWAWLQALKIVPLRLRDFLYKQFAKYRYKIFGRKEVCMMPTPRIRSRFIT